ncbi:MAG: type II toxin-antitoxin system VapC family toxin [Candidatus Bathyarchaeota archaeon]|nr:type II toxin-antitoxin system VapC family toxin [Candidatus Bathyarchaeota archaeon]
MKRYLLDASSFMLLMKTADPQTTLTYLEASCILDLTFYEVGNAIFKETYITNFLTKQESETLKNRMQKIFSATQKLSPTPDQFQQILDISESEKLTFYDASYLFAAKENGLILVTEDKQLKNKAQKHIQTTNAVTLNATKPKEE